MALAVIVLPSLSARPRLGPPLRPWLPLLALAPTMTLRLVGGSSQLGPAWLWLAGPLEKRGEIYSAPEVLQTTNRYNENDGVSKRVHELPVAFGIVICFDAPQRLRFPRLTFATKKLSTGTSLSGQRRMQLILLSARAVTSPFKLSGPGPMAERVSVN